MSQVQPLSSLAPEYNTKLPNSLKVENVMSNDCNKQMECPAKPACAKEPECPKQDECSKKTECDPCYKTGWGWLGALILWFIIFTVLFWLIFYSLKPSFVLQTDSNQVDTAKVLLAAVIAALILVVVIWLIKVAINRR